MQLRQGCKLWWLAIPAIAIDRVCKIIALRSLTGGAVTAIPGVLSWTFVKNTGAAFGILAGNWLLPLITFALMAVLLIWLLRHPDAPRLLRAGLWIIIGGGLGNLYDRLAYGYVIDFIRLDFVNFAVFNPADVFVCLGAALAVVSVLLSERRKGNA
ncbi:MAG: signal peptidase II [Clostridia bacterium]|nr:signal peptidase II [Clostridia bacterium]